MSCHAKVQPGNLSSRNPQITRMRVRVEKTIFQDLLTIIFRSFFANLRHVISGLSECINMIDLDAVDIGHSEQTGCSKLGEHLRAGDIGNVFLMFIKPHQIVRFSYKIHLFLRSFQSSSSIV